jgi:hypothetical protein
MVKLGFVEALQQSCRRWCSQQESSWSLISKTAESEAEARAADLAPVVQELQASGCGVIAGTCSRPELALTAIRYAAQNSVAIGGTADITGLEAAGGSIGNDPTRK